jgi:hypothetical protein
MKWTTRKRSLWPFWINADEIGIDGQQCIADAGIFYRPTLQQGMCWWRFLNLQDVVKVNQCLAPYQVGWFYGNNWDDARLKHLQHMLDRDFPPHSWLLNSLWYESHDSWPTACPPGTTCAWSLRLRFRRQQDAVWFQLKYP